jgi:hypothetical protein
VFAFTLAAPRRGVDNLASVNIPAGTTDVTVRMELELNDFPQYRAVLKDPSSDRVLWRSGALKSEAQAASKVVPVMIPARHFDAQRYIIELEGVPASAAAELIGTYAFRVVIQPAR